MEIINLVLQDPKHTTQAVGAAASPLIQDTGATEDNIPNSMFSQELLAIENNTAVEIENTNWAPQIFATQQPVLTAIDHSTEHFLNISDSYQFIQEICDNNGEISVASSNIAPLLNSAIATADIPTLDISESLQAITQDYEAEQLSLEADISPDIAEYQVVQQAISNSHIQEFVKDSEIAETIDNDMLTLNHVYGKEQYDHKKESIPKHDYSVVKNMVAKLQNNSNILDKNSTASLSEALPIGTDVSENITAISSNIENETSFIDSQETIQETVDNNDEDADNIEAKPHHTSLPIITTMSTKEPLEKTVSPQENEQNDSTITQNHKPRNMPISNITKPTQHIMTQSAQISTTIFNPQEIEGEDNISDADAETMMEELDLDMINKSKNKINKQPSAAQENHLKNLHTTKLTSAKLPHQHNIKDASQTFKNDIAQNISEQDLSSDEQISSPNQTNNEVTSLTATDNILGSKEQVEAEDQHILYRDNQSIIYTKEKNIFTIKDFTNVYGNQIKGSSGMYKEIHNPVAMVAAHNITEGVNQFTLHLHPQELGEIAVEIFLRDNNTHNISIHADKLAHKLLHEQRDDLENRLRSIMGNDSSVGIDINLGSGEQKGRGMLQHGDHDGAFLMQHASRHEEQQIEEDLTHAMLANIVNSQSINILV